MGDLDQPQVLAGDAVAPSLVSDLVLAVMSGNPGSCTNNPAMGLEFIKNNYLTKLISMSIHCW